MARTSALFRATSMVIAPYHPERPALALSAGVRTRLIAGLLAQTYGRVVMLVGQIMTVPVLVTAWGAAGYGEWITLTALASYLLYANVGVPGAVRADMAIAYSEGGHGRMAQVFQTSLLLVGGFGLIAGVAFIFGIHVLRLQSVMQATFMTTGEAKFVATAFALQIVFLLLVGVLQAAISAVGRYALSNVVESSRFAVEFLILLIAVGLFRTRPGIACIVFPLTALINLAIMIMAALRYTPWIVAPPWRFHPHVLRRLIRPMLGVLATSFGYYSMSVQAPRIVLSLTLGPAAVATYAISTMLMRLVRMPIDIVAHSPTVELSLAHGEGDMERARHILTGTMRGSFWLAVCLVPVAATLGPSIVHFWTRGAVNVPVELLLLLSISTLLFSVALPCQEALMSLGRLDRATKWLALGGGPFLFLLYIMIRCLGIAGAGAAVVLLDCAYVALGFWWTLRFFDLNAHGLWRQLLTPPLDLIARLRR